ncbi:MAG TPA: hypothetical protein VFJ82_27040 [Longimicrobium sp.]|nr:hypothetical protein [Longimicrobium sp.]
MDPKDAALLVMMFIVFCVPVLALTARFTLKPILEALMKLREQSQAGLDEGMQRRMLYLEDEVRQLRGTVAGLEATVEFQQKLLSSAPTSSGALEIPAAEA